MTAPASPERPATRIVPAKEITAAPGSRTLRFEGSRYASGVSFYLVTNDPGQGPALHRHPYTETWTVIEGRASIQVGDEVLDAGPGDTAVVQPGTWHGFTNSGEGTLRIICIHASPDFIQDDWHPDVPPRDTSTSGGPHPDGTPPAALA